MSNSAERERVRGRANHIYKSKKAALDRASEEAAQRALASGNVEKLNELLSHLDQMIRTYRDL